MEHARIPNWVWAVLALVHIMALTWALHSGHWHFPDSERYQIAAKNLVQHGQLYARAWPSQAPSGQAVQEFSIRPPAYPGVLAVLGSGVGNPWLVLLVQNALSVLTLSIVLSWWARQAQPSNRHWLMALGLIVIFPAQLIYANAVMSEQLLQATLLALIIATGAFYRTGKLRFWVGLVSATMLALLLKPVCCLLAAGVGVAGLVLGWRRHRPMLLVIGLMPLLVMGAYMAWNQQRTGYFHFSSITEINLLHYNAAGVVRQAEGPAAEEAWVAQVLRLANAQNSFAARQRLIQQQAEVILLAHPWIYARQHVAGMATFFLDPGRFDISEFLGLAPLEGGGLLAQVRAGGMWRAVRQLPWTLLTGLLVVVVANIIRLVLAVRGFRRLGRDAAGTERALRWIAVGLLGYLALLTGPLGAARFLMPVWPMLLGLALVGLRGPQAKPVANDANG